VNFVADIAVQSEACVLRSLLVVGVNLTTVPDRRRMLDVILREARRLVAAEAGTLYTVEDERLRFAAAQNDRMEMSAVHQHLLDRELPITAESLAGFVAMTGRAVNLPDAAHLPSGAPYRICRRLDSATGYRTRSVLALPLTCPDGHCVGVLQLINHVEADGTVTSFGGPGDGVRSLAAMAAVTLHNHQLQEQLRQAHLETIMRLSVAAEYRDDDTGEHVRRISGTSAVLAEELGLDTRQTELVRWASPMHDIGKIGIPDAILLKPGPLDEQERRVMERHALIGAGILGEPKNELTAMAREVALSHHERWDGGGYPNGWAGEDIPLAGRIVGCADVFDALVCKRCYKKAFPRQVALGILEQESGRHFDPRVVEAFLRRKGEIVGAYGAPKTEGRAP
jgi:HD-GYP domain-containing protein (c-di-GMP phosphodiesterase class II)